VNLLVREEDKPARTIAQRWPLRWYQAQELRALIELSGAFSQTWWYGDMLIPPPPLDNSDAAQRMIVVLRK